MCKVLLQVKALHSFLPQVQSSSAMLVTVFFDKAFVIPSDADLPGLRCPAMPCDALSLRCIELVEMSKGACRREPAEGSLPKCNPYPE